MWQITEEVSEYSHLAKVLLNCSHDYGTNWMEEPTILHSKPSSGRWPDDIEGTNLLTDNTGNVYFISPGVEHKLMLQVSRDHGHTWSDARDISYTSYRSALDLLAVADDQGRIGVIFETYSDDIYFKYSNDFGESWSKDIRIGWAKYTLDNKEIITDGNGRFHCVWVADEEKIHTCTLVIPLNENLYP